MYRTVIVTPLVLTMSDFCQTIYIGNTIRPLRIPLPVDEETKSNASDETVMTNLTEKFDANARLTKEDDESYLEDDAFKSIYDDNMEKTFPEGVAYDEEKYTEYGGPQRYVQRMTHAELLRKDNTNFCKNPVEYENALYGSIPEISHTKWTKLTLTAFNKCATQINMLNLQGETINNLVFVVRTNLCALYTTSAKDEHGLPAVELIFLLGNARGKFVDEQSDQYQKELSAHEAAVAMGALVKNSTHVEMRRPPAVPNPNAFPIGDPEPFIFRNSQRLANRAKEMGMLHASQNIVDGYIADCEILGPNLLLMTIPMAIMTEKGSLNKLVTVVVNTAMRAILAKHAIVAEYCRSRTYEVATDLVTGERIVKIIDCVDINDEIDNVITFIMIKANSAPDLEFENCFSFYGDMSDSKVYNGHTVFIGKAKPSALSEEYSDYTVPVRFNIPTRELSFNPNPCSRIYWSKVNGKMFIGQDFYDMSGAEGSGCIQENGRDQLKIRDKKFPSIARGTRSVNLELVYRLNMLGAYPMLYDHKKELRDMYFTYYSALQLWQDDIKMFARRKQENPWSAWK